MYHILIAIFNFFGFDKSELEARHSISQLRSMSDRDLRDMGLTRGSIEYTVRNGR